MSRRIRSIDWLGVNDGNLEEGWLSVSLAGMFGGRGGGGGDVGGGPGADAGGGAPTVRVTVGQNTADMQFTLDTVNCIGCCGQSPVISINDDIFGYLDQKKVIDVLHRFSSSELKNEQVKA